MNDLLLLVPDKNTKFVLDGLLTRHLAFHIKKLKYEIYIHPQRDPGVYRHGADFLRGFYKQYEKAIIFVDREGTGQEVKTAGEIEADIKSNAEKAGWKGRIEVIVLDPELEIWAWVQSPHLAINLGWKNFRELKVFVNSHGYWENGQAKPTRPKEAMEIALREKRIPRSSAIYKKIAETASFAHCQEPSFLKFKKTLIKWFALESDKE